jgi:O-antigen/teichoic acid export membrane protein
MKRALTIRFGVMCFGAAVLDVILNLVRPAPGLVGASLLVYLVAGSAVIVRYCLAHEDEIPPRRRDARHR